MRGGQTPVLIQRWAPSDFQDDEEVRLMLFERDWQALIFYRQFIDHSFIAGGDLPAEPRRLAAKLLLPVEVVEHALGRLLGVLVHEDGDRLYQTRVRREIEAELAYRAGQAEAGRKSGASRRRKARRKQPEGASEGGPKVASSKPEASPNPPAPLPAPAPPPLPTSEKEASPLVQRPENGAAGPEPPALDLDLPETDPDPPPKRKPTNPGAERVRQIFLDHGVPEKLAPPWPVAGRWVKQWNGTEGPGLEKLVDALGKLGEQGHLARGFAWTAKILGTWLAYGGKEPPPVEAVRTRSRRSAYEQELTDLTAAFERERSGSRPPTAEEARRVLRRIEEAG